MTEGESFFLRADDTPLRQGDILLAGVARLIAEAPYRPPHWSQLDRVELVASQARPTGEALRILAGPALVMVTSHDCHFDKEWNRERRRLMKAGMLAEVAERMADADITLDRTFNAAPLVHFEDVAVDRGNLLAGRVVGYLPIPASLAGEVPASVADLSYRCTLDRMDVVRVVSVTNGVRARLRHALSRLDVLRSPTIGFDIEAAVGREITGVTITERDPLAVRLELDGGRIIELWQRPGEPDVTAPARRLVPRSPA